MPDLRNQADNSNRSLNSSILPSEIEEESSGRTFSFNSNQDSVSEETDSFSQPLEELSRGLESSANGDLSEISLMLSMEERAFIRTYSAATDQEKLNLTLQLIEKTVEQKHEVQKLQEKHQVEIQKSQESLQDSVYAEQFSLTNDNKTATASVSPFSCLEILQHIRSRGQYCFSCKINKTARKLISLGIINETKDGWVGNSFHYRWSMFDGRICGKANQQPNENGPFGGEGAIIKMEVDMDQCTLAFYVNQRLINSCNISKSEKYFVYISLGDVGDSVTLL